MAEGASVAAAPGALPPRALILTGPTGSGKSAWAMRVAAELPIEIISVDSAQVYRGLDIGTAKPSAAERSQVPHHLLDLRDPAQRYSAGDFVVDATLKLREIHARGRLPVLVGGTLLYLRALLRGIAPLPSASPQVRAQIEAEARERGWAAMHAQLREVDERAAARIHPNDPQRIQRALEVYRVSGQPLSSFHREKPASQALPPLISLEPDDRAWLHKRIEARFHQMLDLGLIDEVQRLGERGDLHADLPSMRCVGYRQTWEALAADDLNDLPERGVAATRQLAKRQLTWLRSMPQRHRIACDADGAVDAVVALAMHLSDTLPGA